MSVGEEVPFPKIPKTAHFSFRSFFIFSNLPQWTLVGKRCSLRVRHKSEHSPIICVYARNVMLRAIWICPQVLEFTNISFGVSEGDLPFFLHTFIFFGADNVPAFTMRYGN